MSGTYSTSTDLGIGVSPGIVAFVNNYTAVEVSVGSSRCGFWQSTSEKRPDLYCRSFFQFCKFFVLTYFLLA